MKKAITISVITIIGLLLAVLIFLSIRSSRIVYNNDNAIGNSAGNLNNGGLFCEYNNKIYFANPYDYNKLYVMNSDCTNAMKLMMTVLHPSMSVAVTYIMSRIISSRKQLEQYSGDSYSVFTAVT